MAKNLKGYYACRYEHLRDYPGCFEECGEDECYLITEAEHRCEDAYSSRANPRINKTQQLRESIASKLLDKLGMTFVCESCCDFSDGICNMDGLPAQPDDEREGCPQDRLFSLAFADQILHLLHEQEMVFKADE